LAQKRIAPLLALFRPTVLVANHVTSRNVSSRSGHYHIVRAIEKMARKQSAELVLFSRGDMQRVFGTASAITKEGIAAQVALMFSELTWKLPPVRKTWETEHHNMPIFDAVAIGITYFTLIGDAARANPQSPQTRTPG
jgi:hypothetical protein